MRDQSPEIKLLQEISNKLDDLITLFSVQGKGKEEQIKIMADKDYSNSEMGRLLGMPKGTVDTIRAKLNK